MGGKEGGGGDSRHETGRGGLSGMQAQGRARRARGWLQRPGTPHALWDWSQPLATRRPAVQDVLPYFEGPDVDLRALAEAECWAPAPGKKEGHSSWACVAGRARTSPHWLYELATSASDSAGFACGAATSPVAVPNETPSARRRCAAESAPRVAVGDAVSQLVDIWGSHDLFVSEYRWGRCVCRWESRAPAGLSKEHM